MNPDTTQIILGPPGTGKTTRLLRIVDELLAGGVQPEEICFLSFTKKAAAVAVERAVEKFQLPPNRFPYFRTLHSLAFQTLGLQRNQVMGFGQYIDVARMLGISISGKGMSEDGTFAGFEKGDRLLFTENLARVKMISVRELWETELSQEILQIEELEQLHETLNEYKNTNDRMDFTDMIHRFIAEQPVPNFRKLIIDESQDLSRCQWKMVDILSSKAEHTYIAGDDDQAIFRWAGADVDTFINLKGHTEVLGQSYRVPESVSMVAHEIISKCSVRREKEWKPRDEKGAVEHVMGLDMIDMSEGTWLLLARNSFMLKKFEDYCTTGGYLYTSPAGNALRGPAWEAVRIWERLRAGKQVTNTEAIKVYELMSVRERVLYGFKGKLVKLEKANPQGLIDLKTLRESYGLVTDAIWHEALDRLNDEDREYFLAALRRGEKMNREPRIKISTIHGAKGGEAENVVILTDMAMRTYQEYLDNPDDEVRVWYVAVTRALKKLFIVQPQTVRYFDI